MGDLGREGSEASGLSPKLSADTPGDMATTRSRSSSAGISRAPMIIALAALMIGALAVVLAAAPFRAFELDRFFVPKELALHATALVAAMACLWGAREIVADRVDTVLAAFAALCIVSAIFASNHWLALRGVAVTLSGLAIFWCSRAIGEAGWRRPIIAAVIVACTVAAATSLAQAYGVTSDYFTLSRAPGGTLGNRNFVAHLAAIGSPLIVWYAVTARRMIAFLLCTVASAIVAAALVLSRSRAAWLALLVVGVLFAIPMWRAARRVPHADAGRRIIFLGVLAIVGVALALALPNRLNWKSDSPYLDSVKGVVDYSSGSGHGRIIQYRNTLKMVAHHPVLGVGPGNWAVQYPRYASRNDPSLTHDDPGMTANPWPSSDWVAFVAERGPLAVVLLLVAVIGIVANAFRSVRGSGANNPAARDPFLPIALVATVLVTGAVGMFDAVLLLAPPTLLVWAALGALSPAGRARHTWTLAGRTGRRWSIAVLAMFVVFTVRSALAVQGMNVFGPGERLSAVRNAAYWDPGSYRVQLRLAELSLAQRGCSAARGPARRAAAMFPTAVEPRAILRRCGGA